MFIVSKTEVVKRRINLVKKLTELKEHFRIKNFEMWDYSKHSINQYQDYSGLRLYLLLTCFDVLGQKNQHVTVEGWLNSKKQHHVQEREQAILDAGQVDVQDVLKYVVARYQRIYGVKTAFQFFIRNVLTPQNRAKLLESIRIRKQFVYLPEDENKHLRRDKPFSQEDWNRARSKELEYSPSDDEKLEFLYTIRNSFTHKGISMVNGLHGLAMFNDLDYEVPQLRSRYFDESKKLEFVWFDIYRKESDTGELVIEVLRWPYVLIEVLEESLIEDNAG